MIKKLEVIGFSIADCIIARDAGANRIELCANPADGGTTPSYGFIKEARQVFPGELYAMIRPVGGNFLYTSEEFSIMKTDLLICRQLGCDGIVTGILSADNKVDTPRVTELVELAYPLGVTFHRAFDKVADPFEALEDIINAGCERILTSGLQPEAFEGIKLIKQLIEIADDRLIIMPGSGIRESNLKSIIQSTGASEFHSSARKKSIETINKNPGTDAGLGHQAIDQNEIIKMIEIIRNS